MAVNLSCDSSIGSFSTPLKPLISTATPTVEIALQTIRQQPTQRSSLLLTECKSSETLAELQTCLTDPSSALFQAQAATVVAQYEQEIETRLNRLQVLNGMYWEDPESLLHQTSQEQDLTQHTALTQERDALQIDLQELIGKIKKHLNPECTDSHMERSPLLDALLQRQTALGGINYYDTTSPLSIAYRKWETSQSSADLEVYTTLNVEYKTLEAKIALVTLILSMPSAEQDVIHQETVESIHTQIATLTAQAQMHVTSSVTPSTSLVTPDRVVIPQGRTLQFKHTQDKVDVVCCNLL